MNTNKVYFDTTGENNQAYHKIAQTQNEKILSFFEKYSGKQISASMIEINSVLNDNTPITSIRRALNTLERENKIYRVGKTMGWYGRKEFTYRLVENKGK